MKSIEKLLTIANKFEKKIAQLVSAQPVDIEKALKDARLWDLSVNVAPLLEQVGIPESSKVIINILVSNGPTVNYNVILDPDNKNLATKLSALLNKNYGSKAINAIKTAKLNVPSPITVAWLKY